MKQFKIKAAHLAAGLNKVLKAKSSNSIMSAIENVHAKSFPGGLILTCTDLELTIITGVAAEVEEADIEFLIPPQAHTVINYLKDEDTDITVKVTPKELSFSYDNNVMKFEPEDVTTFPKAPTLKKVIEFEIEESPELFTIFDDCLKFASKDDLRPAMTGVYFSDKEIAGTDAHRLLKAKYKTPGKSKFEIILQRSLINALPILDSKTKFKIGDTHISINDSSTQIICRHIDAKYPNYNSVIPKDNEYHITINAAEVKRNIRIASSLTTKDKKVVFDFSKTTYTLKGNDADLSQEILLNGKCQVAHVENFEGIGIAFNGGLLTQLLDIAGSNDLTFEIGQSNRAMVVNEDIYTLLLMPLLYANTVTEESKPEPQAAEQVPPVEETQAAQPEPAKPAKIIKKEPLRKQVA